MTFAATRSAGWRELVDVFHLLARAANLLRPRIPTGLQNSEPAMQPDVFG